MKKILFATTALVATASVAAADVTFSGYARFGVENYDAYNGNTNGTQIDTRVQLGVSGSAETDGGVKFSVYSRMRVDDSERGDGFNAPTMTVESGAMKVQLGNTYSAIGARTNVFGSMTGHRGDFGLFDRFDTWYSSTGAAGMDRVRVDYTMGTTTVSASADISGTDEVEVGLSTTVGSLNIGVGISDEEQYAADINMAFGDVTVGARLTDTISGAYANYTQGALGLQVFAADEDVNGNGEYGVGMTYDLGGGASFGAEVNENSDWNMTIGFNF